MPEKRYGDTEESGRGKWHSFLRINKNKTELFRFLSEQIITNIETSKIVIAAFEDRV